MTAAIASATPIPAATVVVAATAAGESESPWRRRSSFEPYLHALPLNLDDADLPVSEV